MKKLCKYTYEISNSLERGNLKFVRRPNFEVMVSNNG